MYKTIKILLIGIIIFAFTQNANSQDLKGRFTIASKKKLELSDIENLTYKELYYMRNEIFARHGYIFQTYGTFSYFKKQDWYEPSNENIDEFLTDIEKNNIIMLKERQDNFHDFKSKNELIIYSDSSSFIMKEFGMGSSIENTSFSVKSFIDQDIEKRFIIKKHKKQFSHHQVDAIDTKVNIELYKIGPVRAEKTYEISSKGEVELLQGNGIVFSNTTWVPELTNDVIKLFSINNPDSPFIISNQSNHQKKMWLDNGKILWISFYYHDDKEWIDYYTKQSFPKLSNVEKNYIGTLIISDETHLLQMFDFQLKSLKTHSEKSLNITQSKGDFTINFSTLNESIKFQYLNNRINIVKSDFSRVKCKERSRE